MRFPDRMQRAWLALTNPRADDDPSREHWWREIVADLTAERDRRDRPVKEQSGKSEEAAHAWRVDGRFRSILKKKASFIVGSDLSIDVVGDRRAAEFVEEFVKHPLNCPRGSMVEGTNGFLLRVFQWYLAALRDGDLYVILYPQMDGLSIARSRPKRAIAYTHVDPEDHERELWYAEIQATPPAPKEMGDRSKWATTWDAPGEASLRLPEMLHYSYDPLDAATHGESLASTVRPWTLEYERLLRARVGVNITQSMITWLVDMPNTDWMIRAERKRQMEREGWTGSGFLIQDSAREAWEMQSPNSGGSEARSDMRAVRDEAIIAGGLLPMWSGEEGSDLSLASARSISPIAASALRADQQEYFGFISAVVSRAVDKWTEFRNLRIQDWNISVCNAESVAYELAERGSAFSDGVNGVEKALIAGIIDLETARSLTRYFAGLPEDMWPEVDSQINRFRFSLRGTIRPADRPGSWQKTIRERLAQRGGDRAITEAVGVFERDLTTLLEAAVNSLETQIASIADAYGQADDRGQAQLLTKLSKIRAEGQAQYRTEMAEWLRDIYAAAQPLVSGGYRPPAWVEAWIGAQASALAERQWSALTFTAIETALREITSGQSTRVTLAATQQAVRGRINSGLDDWDQMARTFVEKLVEEGVWVPSEEEQNV